MTMRLTDRAVLAGPVIAAVTLLAATIVTRAAGVSLRGFGQVSLARFATASALTAVVALAVALARRRQARPAAWTATRVACVALALGSFYVTYFAYRCLKSAVPLVRPGVLDDRALGRLDHGLAGGHAPAELLQDTMGRGAAAVVLSHVYLAFFAFIPLVLAVALGGVVPLRAGLLVVVALTGTWALGAVSYYLLPSLGPFHAEPATFAHLRPTSVTHMQHQLIADRLAFIRRPSGARHGQSVGAFASLHVAVYVATMLAARVAGAGRRLLLVLALATTLTVVSTVYFGWHYLADDAAGAVIAGVCVWAARIVVGDLAAAPALVAATAPA